MTFHRVAVHRVISVGARSTSRWPMPTSASMCSFGAPSAGRSGRRNAVAVEGDRHVRPTEPHVVVVDQVLTVGLMLGLAFVEVVARDRVLRQRRRLDRERLRRRSLLARQVALRHRALLDIEDRLASDAVEREQQSHLRGDDHGGNRLTVALQVDEKRRRLDREVPEAAATPVRLRLPRGRHAACSRREAATIASASVVAPASSAAIRPSRMTRTRWQSRAISSVSLE